MKFQLHKGEAAQRWSASEPTRRAWQGLHESCPWATELLSPEFAETWYEHYGSLYQPLLVTATDDSGALVGLMPLAQKSGEITGVGAHQAEYQSWLGSSKNLAEFLDGALRALFTECPNAKLQLRYIDLQDATGPLVNWVNNRPDATLNAHSRPLLKLDEEAIVEVLRKRSNRSKLNRLKRLGELELQTDYLQADPAAGLDEIIRMYDFRQGAANDSCPFVDDESKRGFHLAVLKQAPKVFVAYRLQINGETVAALLGVRGPQCVSNAIFTYSPHLAKHSPGKFLLYLAGQTMLADGVKFLDLTPGGDAWKERFATDHDEVYELTVWGNRTKMLQHQRQSNLQATARSVLIKAGLPPKKLRSWASLLKKVRPESVLNAVKKPLPSTTEYRIYRLDLNQFPGSPAANISVPANTFNTDKLNDLVHFEPTSSWQSRQSFLSAALTRLENGEQVYSARENGVLLHYGWLVPEQSEAFFTEVGEKYKYPEPGTVLYDFLTHPSARGKRLYQQAIATMLRDAHTRFKAAPTPNTGKNAKTEAAPGIVYISVLANNMASRHVIEKLGFEYVESLVRTSAFGRSQCNKIFREAKS